jgi:hypothetical protein
MEGLLLLPFFSFLFLGKYRGLKWDFVLAQAGALPFEPHFQPVFGLGTWSPYAAQAGLKLLVSESSCLRLSALAAAQLNH